MENVIEQTILIIDNDESEIIITKRVLSKIVPTFKTVVALSGEAGLSLLRSGDPLPALILLDLKMPGLSGIDVLRNIRADERLRQLPVIIVTNSILESDRQKALADDVNAFLNKNFDLDQYGKDIKALIEQYMVK